MAHTPGPWRVGRRGSVVADSPVPQISGSDAVEYYGGHLIAESITPSNAALVAAAPDFYGALTIADIDQIIEAIENFVMGPGEDPELDAIWQPYIDKLNVLRAAILKAEGRA